MAKNKSDATLRNVKASKKRDVSLSAKIKRLEAKIKKLEAYFK